MSIRTTLLSLMLLGSTLQPTVACTGITLHAADGSTVVARTIEWGGSNLNSCYVIVPRGYRQRSFTPSATPADRAPSADGASFTAQYGYVGLSVEMPQFVAEGLNEAGLSAGLFYFPGYGQYPTCDSTRHDRTIADLQLVSLVLGSCATVDEVERLIATLCVVSVDPRASTVHWRFADRTGRQVVLEYIDGQPRFYENHLGVLTNSPGFEWQLTNLNNYVNLHAGSAPTQTMEGLTLAPFGAGSGMLGLPGDVTPPSRFVRAAFYQSTAPQQATSEEAVLQGFQILNNFDIPIGIEFPAGRIPADLPSATQWTSASDPMQGRIYYRTMYNSAIRCIDLRAIDFRRVHYRCEPLDTVDRQPVTMISVTD